MGWRGQDSRFSHLKLWVLLPAVDRLLVAELPLKGRIVRRGSFEDGRSTDHSKGLICNRISNPKINLPMIVGWKFPSGPRPSQFYLETPIGRRGLQWDPKPRQMIIFVICKWQMSRLKRPNSIRVRISQKEFYFKLKVQLMSSQVGINKTVTMVRRW